MKKLYFLIFSLGCIINAYAQDLPRPSEWVNDISGVISEDYKNKINALIVELEAKTSAEVFVVTQNTISPYDEKEYSRMLFNNWKPGKLGSNNGVLVLLAIKEGRWRIETGKGIKGPLSDKLCGKIERYYMSPYFKNGEYGEGLYQGVAAVADIIAQNSNVTLNTLGGITFPKLIEKKSEMPVFVYLITFLIFLALNLPWPLYTGSIFSLIFTIAFLRVSVFGGISVLAGYICSLVFRYYYWSKLPPNKRSSFFGKIDYDWRFFSDSGKFGGSDFKN